MLFYMRTTIRMDDDLLEMAKIAAVRSNRTLTSFIEDAVRHQLELERRASTSDRPGLLIFRGTGVRPGIDLDANASVLAAMEEDP